MRIPLVLICCLGLASFAGAAQQQDNQQNQQKKKKGQSQQMAPQQQGTAPQTGKKYYKKTGKGAGPYNQNVQQPATVTHMKTGKKSQGPVNQGNMPNSASNTKFNKSKTVNKNANLNKKYKVQKFNLQTNKVVTKYKTVNYNANYKIAGASHWGPKYAVFVNYHPAWHDAWWWNWQYGTNLVFIYGGWYYWNANYWYPAWGYAPNSVYYFDGPIYASNPTYDPAQVVANVQSALQDQGYYQGDIDGILGPQTRAALAEYQSAQGLEPTGVVDEPTLQTLGMA